MQWLQRVSVSSSRFFKDSVSWPHMLPCRDAPKCSQRRETKILSHLFFILSSPPFSPQYAVIQSGLARGLWLSARGQWTQLHPVSGRGQQRPPGRAAGRGPGPGDWGSQRVNTGSPSRHCYCPDSEEHSSQHRSRVPHTAGPAPFQSITCNDAHVGKCLLWAETFMCFDPAWNMRSIIPFVFLLIFSNKRRFILQHRVYLNHWYNFNGALLYRIHFINVL